MGSFRIRKFLSFVLIVGLLQTFSWTYQIVEAPKANAAQGLQFYVQNTASWSVPPSAINESTSGYCNKTINTMNGAWGSGNAFGLSGCNSDNFTVYGTGYIQGPYTGTVNFCNQADDQFYLIINSNVIINDNTAKAAATGTACNATGTMNMVAGTWYPIQAWVHEQGGGADMRLLWNYPGATTNTLIDISYYRTSAQLSTPASVSASAAANEFGQFTVSWSAVSNASSYRIKLYNAAGNTLLATKSGVAGNSTSNVFTSSDFSQLANGTSYKVTVTAIGDGSNYEDSVESSQASVTTSIPTPSTTDFALNLNGSSQYASASGAQVIPASTASTFSIEAWIRQPSSRSSTAFYQIFSQGSSANLFYAKVVDGSVRFGRSGYTGGENICQVKVPTEEWTHVALVVGAASQSCYINGALAGSFTQNGATAIGTTFAIGQFTPTGTELFLGQIDEVKIWSTDRSASVATDMQTYNPNTSGLVAYYDFNELVGDRIINRTTGGSSAYNLTRTGAPTVTSTSIIETSTVNAYTVVKFLRTFLVADGGWKTPANRQLRVFAVGGGGGGGFNSGGGGSGGGYLETMYSANLETVSVVVGVGGLGAGPSAPRTIATNGTASLFRSSSAGGGNYGINYVSGSAGGSAVNGYGKGGNGTQSSSIAGSAGNAGFSSNITGTVLNYGGGGGGGGWATSTNGGAGGAGGGGAGAGANLSAPVNGSANFGGGGGASREGTQIAANGGSGVVIIAYITDTPTIITQPLSDTTTAGIVETFTVTTNAVPAPLTKSVQWQFTADTTTGTTGWSNVSSGTGGTTDTFTTAALTKSMNKYRYRVIVTFSDTSTLSVIETSTVAILTINDSITITSSTSTITRKYGETQTVRTITYSGGTTSTGAVGTSTSHTVRGSYGSLANGKIVLDTSTSTAVFRADTGTVVGSYVETITVTDFKGATATYTQQVVVNPADTLTVQADTLTAITYGGSLSPTYTASGFVNGDSIATITYGHVSCANGGKCAVGDIGPGGGVVFYEITNSSDSQTAISGYTSGGIYLEAAPVGWGNGISVAAGETTGTSYLDPVVNWCNTTGNTGATQIGIGQGGNNTKLGDLGCSSGAVQIATDLVLNGKSDWYLPSENELNQMAEQKNLVGLLYGLTNCYGTTCYWSSTEVGGGSSSRALQISVSSHTMGNNDKGLTASNKVMMRPIRAFSPITNNTETITAGAPTAAGTYLLRPTAITLANGVDTSNYVSVVFRSSQSSISRANQSPKISMQPAKAIYDTGTATQVLNATSSSATGAVFYLIAAGSATGCSISGSTLSITSTGVCNVMAFKQASANYLYDSATAVAITFTRFVSNQPVQIQLYPTMIPLNGANALETTTVTVSTLTISSVTKTGAGAYTIGGTGFSNIEVLRIGGSDLTGSNYTVGGVNSITLTGVSAFTGPLFIRKTDGQEVVYFQFDWSQ